jgi:hypothetical protein
MSACTIWKSLSPGSTGNTLTENQAKGSKGFDPNNPVPADNTVDDTNSCKTTGP